ncbi:hypothetical protein CL618_02010 [archaeon]|nr:hypothetical protein [archaeon]|tara:strand:+ start:3735 stop:5504 length:1770 start_codon:yes stop_codon:yes gene_type:complete
MNKNKVFLSSILIVLILLGAYFVFGGHSIISTGRTINTNIGPANWTGGDFRNEIVNFTINNSGANTTDELVGVLITIPTSDGVYLGNSSIASVNISAWGGSGFVNNTADSRDVWNFSTYTTSAGQALVVIFNSTDTGHFLKENETINVWLNITVNNSLGDGGDLEKYLTWNITTFDNSSSIANGNETLLTTSHGVDVKKPRFSSMSASNITYTKSKTDLTNQSNEGWFINTTSVWVTLIVNETNNDTAIICINWTRTIDVSSPKCVNYTMDDRGVVTGNLKNYSYNISSNNTHFVGGGGNVSFIFWVNDTLGNSIHINNTNTSDYRYRVDGTAPTAKLTEPNVKTVETQQSIKYKCRGSDPQSGLKSCTLEVTKPDGSKYTKTGCTTEHKLKLRDTDKAGTYTVQCKVKNRADQLTTTEKKTFLALYPAEPAAEDSGIGDSGITVDVDFSTSDVKKKILRKGQGSVIDFTLDGSTPHTITFTEVMGDKVKLTIASTPSEVELSIGESVEVDIDENGVNDILVTLNSISGGQGEITVEVIRELIPGEKEVTPEEREEQEAKVKSGIGLLIAIIVIVIGIVIYFLVKPKKK